MRHFIGIIGVTSAAVVLAACGSTSSSTPTPTAAAQQTSTPATLAPVHTPSQAPATVDLSGNWSGSYTGPFNGTFKLNWTQTGSDLSGTIVLSSPADSLGIKGTVSGSSISFGAVGVVTYTGTVSGNSMSGSYTDVANGQNGSWNASKS